MSTSRSLMFSAVAFASLVPACEPVSTSSGEGSTTQAVSAERDQDEDYRCPSPSDIPPALQVGRDERLKLRLAAEGVQIYTCALSAGAYAWVSKAPEANLFDDHARYVANHFLGPTWQYRDGSKIVGTVVARATVDTTAIPWLLLHTTSTGLPGRFSDVTSVQRIHTTQGLAPTTPCDASNVNTDVRVPYTADYYFYSRVGHH